MLVRILKAELEVLTGLPLEKQRLLPPLFQVVEDDKTLGSYDIEKIESFYLVEIGTVQIFVKTLLGETLSCWMSSGATVKSLKEELEAIEGIPLDMQRLNFAGKSLEDSNASLLQYNVEEWSTLLLVLRLRGGGTLSDHLTFARVCREWNGDMYCDGVTGLSLAYRQAVIITKKIDDHWFRGRLAGVMEEGVFPSSFVEILQSAQRDLMRAHRRFAPFSSKIHDAQRREEVSHASQLIKQSGALTQRPGLALPPFTYPMIRMPEFKFPLPKSSFIHLSITCESTNTPGSRVNVGVSLSSHAHDSIFVSSIHLTIHAGGSTVLGVHPVSETKFGKHIEVDVQNTTSTENLRQLTGKVGVTQMVTGEVEVTREWKTGTSLQLSGKETIPAQLSGQVVCKNAFWNIQSEITPSRLRGFSGGPVWEGMSFVLDRYSTELEHSLTVNCRIQGDAKDRIIKGKPWWAGK